MRYGVAIPLGPRFIGPEALRAVARAAEDLGYDSLWASDHVIIPEGSTYFPEQFAEPLAVLAYLAAETSHITLGTSVLVMPYRDPVFTAKFLATVDVFSHGRLVVGIGAGALREEFDALSVPYDERGARTDEYLRVWRNLWETETSSFEGRFKRYTDMRFYPKASPARRGTIPVQVGGNSDAAIRRAATLGDGWQPLHLTAEQLGEGVTKYRKACEDAGRPVGQVCLRRLISGRAPRGNQATGGGAVPLTGTPGELAAHVRAYRDAGLDELMLWVVEPTVDAVVTQLRAFMRDVAPRV